LVATTIRADGEIKETARLMLRIAVLLFQRRVVAGLTAGGVK
jgi:hypothetical protein